MTFQPVVPILLLAAVAVVLVVARAVSLRRLVSADGNQNRAPHALWRWAGLTVATLLLLAAAVRPVLGPGAGDMTRVAGDAEPSVFLVVDRSPAMGIRDAAAGATRIAAARNDIETLIDRYPDARFAVVSFATRPTLQWPLSPDTFSLRPELSALTPYPPSDDIGTQTNAGAAATVLRYLLIGARQQYPRAQNLVYYFGAGAPGSKVPQRPFELPKGAVDGGGVLGYGAPAGIDEGALRAVAEQIGVPFEARAADAPPAAVLPGVAAGDAAAASARPSPGRTETYWAFAAGAAVLVLIELYLVLREFRRTRLATVDVAR